MNQCTKGMVSKQYYTYILVVLGTNDIPRANQWDKQQHALRKAMECVLAGLADYPSPTGLGGLFATQVFSFEENHAVAKFAVMMEQVPTKAGARYVRVPWEKEVHTHKKRQRRLLSISTRQGVIYYLFSSFLLLQRLRHGPPIPSGSSVRQKRQPPRKCCQL